jgi:hypothetical protein
MHSLLFEDSNLPIAQAISATPAVIDYDWNLLIHKAYLGTGTDLQVGAVQGPLLVFLSATLVRTKEKTPLGLNLEVSEVGECRLTVTVEGELHRSLVEHPRSPMSTNFIK